MIDDLTYHYEIRFSPSAYPNKWVVKQWRIKRDGTGMPGKVATADSLEEARAYVPPGLVHVARMPDDDPAIVEVWI